MTLQTVPARCGIRTVTTSLVPPVNKPFFLTVAAPNKITFTFFYADDLLIEGSYEMVILLETGDDISFQDSIVVVVKSPCEDNKYVALAANTP